jgi:ATP-dependent protease HslVU (ClpYQ) peptidase subunit
MDLRRNSMSVVAVKVYKDRIEVASDSITVKGWSKVPQSENKFVKMQKINEMIVGGVGNPEETSIFYHYMKTHTIENVDEKGILDFILEFRKWKNDLTGVNALNNEYILAFKGKAFLISNMFVMPIDDYYAIGAGEDYANGAMYMGASPREAVKAACELCAMVCEPVIQEYITR